MASLRDIRRKIKSVKSTQQITKAMKMVSAARMRRAQQAILSARPFAVKLEDTVSELTRIELSEAAEGEISGKRLHPYFKAGAGPGIGLVLVTGDKGLCGAFNANLLRTAINFLREQEGKPVHVAVVGRKGRDFFKRLRAAQVELGHELVGIFPKVSFAHAEILGKAIADAFEQRGLSKIVVVYNEFKSAAAQRVVRKDLLPLAVPEGKPTLKYSEEYRFEPNRHGLLAGLLPRYLKAQIYRILLESQAAELAARMSAMDAASKNASELIGAMTLHLNRTRQAIITREIAELVGGAEALSQ